MPPANSGHRFEDAGARVTRGYVTQHLEVIEGHDAGARKLEQLVARLDDQPESVFEPEAIGHRGAEPGDGLLEHLTIDMARTPGLDPEWLPAALDQPELPWVVPIGPRESGRHPDNSRPKP